MGVLLACVSLHYIHASAHREEGVRSPGIGATMWVMGIEPGPMEEQPVFLTTEPSLNPSFRYFHFFSLLRKISYPVGVVSHLTSFVTQ